MNPARLRDQLLAEDHVRCAALEAASTMTRYCLANRLWMISVGETVPHESGVAALAREIERLGFDQVTTGYHRIAAHYKRQFVLKVPIVHSQHWWRANTSEIEIYERADNHRREHLVPVDLLHDETLPVIIQPYVQPFSGIEQTIMEHDVLDIALMLNLPDHNPANACSYKGRLAFFDYGYVIGHCFTSESWPMKAPEDVVEYELVTA